jgi:hypothetical protein
MQKRDFFPSLSNPDSRERKRQWISADFVPQRESKN